MLTRPRRLGLIALAIGTLAVLILSGGPRTEGRETYASARELEDADRHLREALRRLDSLHRVEGSYRPAAALDARHLDEAGQVRISMLSDDRVVLQLDLSSAQVRQAGHDFGPPAATTIVTLPAPAGNSPR